MQVETLKQVKSYKYTKLLCGLFFDFIGMLSYLFPIVAEITDVIWAPISGFVLTRMYKGNVGLIAGSIDFLEELLPETDVIPTFTLTWIYVFVVKKNK